jgi:hypothetical protein
MVVGTMASTIILARALGQERSGASIMMKIVNTSVGGKT